MKKMNLLGMLAVVGMLAAQSASAVTINITQGKGYFYGSGGEFTVYGTGYESNGYALEATRTTTLGTGFQTFCLERSETAAKAPDGFTVEYYAIMGGFAGASLQPNGDVGDPISVGTAWLYDQFSRGLLDYDYAVGDASNEDSGRSASAGLLQEAFWWLEQEYTLTAAQISANPYLNTVIDRYGASVKDDNETHNLRVGGVAVLNFYDLLDDGSLKHRQSMLVRVPDGGLTVVLLGLGVLGCAALRRRMA